MMTLAMFAIVGAFACGFVLGSMLAVGAAADGARPAERDVWRAAHYPSFVIRKTTRRNPKTDESVRARRRVTAGQDLL